MCSLKHEVASQGNNTINLIKPKITFLELKNYDLYQGDA